MKKRRPAFQFKISLLEIKPTIWRRIQVSDLYSFWDLHVAIQDSMGWWDYHLHHFGTDNPITEKKEIIGIPEYCYDEEPHLYETLPGWNLKIRDYFNKRNSSMEYLYDYGDGWRHLIEFEGAVEKEAKEKYPLCIAGKRACPPEDVGGVYSFEKYCDIMDDPTHVEYQFYVDWRGPYDPNKFDHQEVRFSSPSLRWKKAFNSECYD